MLSMGTGRPSLSSGASASSAAHLQEHPTYSNERTLQEHTPPSTISAAVPPVPALSLGPDARHLVDRAVPLPNPSSSAAAELSSPVRPLPEPFPPLFAPPSSAICTSQDSFLLFWLRDHRPESWFIVEATAHSSISGYSPIRRRLADARIPRGRGSPRTPPPPMGRLRGSGRGL